jgi:hypothetical protein
VRIVRTVFVLALVGALTISVAAEQRRGEVVLVRPPASPVRFAGPWRPAGSPDTATRVVGSVVDIRQVPVSHVRVQLRDLKNGALLKEDETDEKGQYEFTLLEPSTYVVEMLSGNSTVVAVSNAGAIGRYQTLQTVIFLPGRWDFGTRSFTMPVPPSSFFGLGSARSMTSSTIVLANNLEIRPMDAGEPVSPR